MEDRITRSFVVESDGRLTLESDLGSIDVQSVEAPTMDVEIIRTVTGGGQDDLDALSEQMEIITDQNEKAVSVRVRVNKAWRRQAPGRRLQLRFAVRVPPACSVDLRTGGGGISVGNLTGTVACRTSGGGISVGRIQGPVFAGTSGGSVDLAGCNGAAELKTSGGGIRIGEVDGDVTATTSGGSVTLDRVAGRASVHTSGGSITLRETGNTVEAITSGGHVTACMTRQPGGHCRLETSGGHVTAYVADDLAFNLVARTSGGHIATDFPVMTKGKPPKTSLNVPINGGGPELIMRTSGGHVSLRRLESKGARDG